MIRKPWTAASVLIAAPAAPLFPTVTVNSRPGPGLGRGGHGHGAAAATPSRVHPPGASDDPRGALTAVSLDAAKVAVNAALSAHFR